MKRFLICITALALGCMGWSDDLSQVKNLKHVKKELKLTKRHLQLLRKNGFVVNRGDFPQIESAYGSNVYTEIPSLVTADTVLQLVHTMNDSALRNAESIHLYYSLRRMSKTLLAATKARYERRPDSAALRNVEYVAVGLRLLGEEAQVPPEAFEKVEAEVALATAHNELKESPIFGYRIDYTQFIPRGHYTRTEELKKYFAASMWFGLVPIALEQRVGNKVVPLPDNVRSVRYLVADWQTSGASRDWGVIDRVVGAFIGQANDLTPKDWIRAGGKLAALRRPAMSSKVMHGLVAGNLQFRLLAQRAIPDSVAMSALSGPKRYWPHPLDVAALLGSGPAEALLSQNPGRFNHMHWPQYNAVRHALEREWWHWTSAQRTSSLYHRHLDLLHEFLKPMPVVAAHFYQTKAYGDLQLTTSLGSWAELRHDSLLYGEQSVAEMGDGEEPKHIKGYVEPRPQFYKKAREWVVALRKVLSREHCLEKEDSKQFAEACDLFDFFGKVASYELEGRRPSKSDYDRLWTIEQDVSELESHFILEGLDYNSVSVDDLDMAVVADVHTAEGMALEVGTGHADELLAIVPIEGKLYLARGEVLSFYFDLVPTSQRLNDHQWKEMARQDRLPNRPDWMKSYFCPVQTAR